MAKQCSICLEDPEKENATQATPAKVETVCKHHFHHLCLEIWFNTQRSQVVKDPMTQIAYRQTSCPVCRHKFSEELADNQKNNRRIERISLQLLRMQAAQRLYNYPIVPVLEGNPRGKIIFYANSIGKVGSHQYK